MKKAVRSFSYITMLCAFVTLLIGCGSNDGGTVSVTLNPKDDDAKALLTDSNVVDVVFILVGQIATSNVTNNDGNIVIEVGSFLDVNKDNSPDTVIFPNTCDSNLVKSCGFGPNEQTFTLTGIPLNYQYTLTVRYRDSNAATLYQGTSSRFSNIEGLTDTITIQVEKV